MLTINAIGRVTKDLEVQYSKAHEPYVRFNFAVNKGYGENAHPVFLQCWVFGGSVERLVKAKVGKGSLLHITGDLDITKFKKKDGETELSGRRIRGHQVRASRQVHRTEQQDDQNARIRSRAAPLKA